MKPNQETLGICRSTLVIIAVAITFGSFSVYKARGGGSLRVAGTFRVPSGTLGRTELSEVLAITNLGSATLTKADAPCPTVKTTLTPIEQIQVGDRVLAESPTGEEDTAFGSEIIPSDWRKLTLRAPKRDGTVAEVVLLRPLTWLNEQRTGRSRLPSGIFAARRTTVPDRSDELGTDFSTTNALNSRDTSRNPARQAGPTVESQTVEDMVGGTVFISVPECGIDGNAQVLAIDPCPEIPSGAGRVVTGTFLHQARSTITLTIAGQSEPIECTGNHPFWSEDRQIFVRADSLQPDETLRTATGLTTVETWTPDLNPTPVYNIEVHGAHLYHVGTSGVVVHNGNESCGLAVIYRRADGHIAVEIIPGGRIAETGEILGAGMGVARHLEGAAGDFVAVADFDVARAIAKRDGGKVIDDFVVVPLKNVNGAIGYIYPGEGKMWQRGSNSCVTYVIGVLQAGGADLSAVPRSMNGGFWDVMKSLFL